jgi:hypothetical protein
LRGVTGKLGPIRRPVESPLTEAKGHGTGDPPPEGSREEWILRYPNTRRRRRAHSARRRAEQTVRAAEHLPPIGGIEDEDADTDAAQYIPRNDAACSPSGERRRAAHRARVRLEDPNDVEAGIKAAPAHDGPVLADVVVNRTELAVPPAITVEMATGFTLYMVKAVMNGRGDELVDLAVSNLRV